MVGLIVGIILFIINIFLYGLLALYLLIIPLKEFFSNISLTYLLFIGSPCLLIVSILFGALIGWIVGKIKNRK